MGNAASGRGDDGESPTQLSPPGSPMVTPRSPLTFGPQIPMAPMPPGDFSLGASAGGGYGRTLPEVPVLSWPVQPTLVPVPIVWCHGGNHVEVEGSYDGWTSRTPLHRSGGRDTWTVIKLLPPGVHQYKFIVDGVWKYAPEQPAMYDERDNVNNVCEVTEVAPENLDNLPNFAPPGSPPNSYDCGLSDAGAAGPSTGAGAAGGTPGGGHPPEQLKEPPQAPPQLHLTLLNVPPLPDAPSILPRPQHVVLNHIYTERPREDGRGGSLAGGRPVSSVGFQAPGSGGPGMSPGGGGGSSGGGKCVVMGVTHRYRSKYVTLVMYKPARRPSWAQPQQQPGPGVLSQQLGGGGGGGGGGGHLFAGHPASPAVSSGHDAMSQG